jgi:transketolase
VPDRFSEHCGSYAYLLREHGLDIDNVRKRIGVYCQSLPPNSIALA